MNDNLRHFLDLIAYSEGTSTIKNSDNGYNVIVGGRLFHNYADHPRVTVYLQNLGVKSTAAGRYQIKSSIYDYYKCKLGLHDFGHEAQDTIAIQLIKECKAIVPIEKGDIAEAIKLCRSRWASLPGAGYGQHEQQLADLLDKFKTIEKA